MSQDISSYKSKICYFHQLFFLLAQSCKNDIHYSFKILLCHHSRKKLILFPIILKYALQREIEYSQRILEDLLFQVVFGLYRFVLLIFRHHQTSLDITIRYNCLLFLINDNSICFEIDLQRIVNSTTNLHRILFVEQQFSCSRFLLMIKYFFT